MIVGNRFNLYFCCCLIILWKRGEKKVCFEIVDLEIIIYSFLLIKVIGL